jgi:hypothetical protein
VRADAGVGNLKFTFVMAKVARARVAAARRERVL